MKLAPDADRMDAVELAALVARHSGRLERHRFAQEAPGHMYLIRGPHLLEMRLMADFAGRVSRQLAMFWAAAVVTADARVADEIAKQKNDRIP